MVTATRAELDCYMNLTGLYYDMDDILRIYNDSAAAVEPPQEEQIMLGSSSSKAGPPGRFDEQKESLGNPSMHDPPGRLRMTSTHPEAGLLCCVLLLQERGLLLCQQIMCHIDGLTVTLTKQAHQGQQLHKPRHIFDRVLSQRPKAPLYRH